jgi:hypothetical protein
MAHEPRLIRRHADEPSPDRPHGQVNADRLESGVEHFDTQPLASDPRLTGEPALEADPPGCMRLASMDPASGEGRAVFGDAAADLGDDDADDDGEGDLS